MYPQLLTKIIFGLDAMLSKFDITRGSGSSSMSTVEKGDEIFTTHTQFPNSPPDPGSRGLINCFSRVVRHSQSRHGADIDPYFATIAGTLRFFDSGILVGE
jgi:hypothetical protein